MNAAFELSQVPVVEETQISAGTDFETTPVFST